MPNVSDQNGGEGMVEHIISGMYDMPQTKNKVRQAECRRIAPLKQPGKMVQ